MCGGGGDFFILKTVSIAAKNTKAEVTLIILSMSLRDYACDMYCNETHARRRNVVATVLDGVRPHCKRPSTFWLVCLHLLYLVIVIA